VIALYRKELRTLLPLQLLLILAQSGDVLYRPLIQRLDEKAWTDISSYLLPDAGEAAGVYQLVFGLLVAYSLFPREHDDLTIEFLYSLPVTRLAIFGAKALAGFTVVAVGALVLQLTDFLLQAWNPQSFVGEQWRFGVSASVALLQSAAGAIVLCHGLLISFFRRFGLIPYAMAGWAALSLERAVPEAAPLNFLNLLELEYLGTRVLIPWAGLALHGTVALVCLAAAAALWTGAGERAAAAWARLHRVGAGRVALGCATVAAVLGLGVLLTLIWGAAPEAGRGDDGGEGLEPVSFQIDRAETARFDFSYPANLRGRALPLIRSADGLHERLRQRLGAGVGARVVVDMTDESPFHEGITAWTKMRVGLAGAEDDARLRYIFAHELVHAFQFQESRRRLGDNPRATAFFAEGGAEYLAFELEPDEARRRSSRRVALAAWSRHRVRFDTLVDETRLSSSYDPLLVYPLGETWTAALVEACGEGAQGRVLRAMGRDGAPTGLEPIAFWQDTLQAAGCGLEEVLAIWERRMDDGVAAEAAFLDALPRIGGGVAGVAGDEVIVVATLDRDLTPALGSELRVVLRVRDGPASDVSQIRTFTPSQPPRGPDRRIEFRVPRQLAQGSRFQLQLGLEFDPRSWAAFEPWQSVGAP
jgi:hypothetical protein